MSVSQPKAFEMRQPKSKWRKFLKSMHRSAYLQLLALPGLVYFFVFSYIPMYGVIIAFKNYSLRKGILGSDWVGLKHFISFFNNPYFGTLLKNTVLLSTYNLLWGFLPPILLALLLNEPMNARFRKTVQTITYMPHFISSVAIVGMLFMILSPNGGLINKMLEGFGVESIYFLVKPEWFRTIFVGSGIWQGMGFNAIIYIAALSGIDPALYEAATIDGASRMQKIRFISLPGIRETIVVLLILNIGRIMNVSTEKVLLLQNSLTFSTSDIIGSYVYRRGLVELDFSYGSAVGLFNSIINILLLITANAISRKMTQSGLF